MHAGMLLIAFAASLMAVAQEPEALSPMDKAPLPFSLRLKEDAIAKAVRETIAETRTMDKAREGTTSAAFSAQGILKGDRYEEFGRQFSEAQKPSCIGPDALKHQPTGFTVGGWNFGVAGLLALPLWGAAIVRGKCN